MCRKAMFLSMLEKLRRRDFPRMCRKAMFLSMLEKLRRRDL
ncbi:hypothetical protein VitviT2T_003041 [Vitis vinifera]|uniref:Uncharacterized protein n=1 Tax=Vitis vinifera TaxID=29760 RepID=A0ABY9BKM4_VITVI|nr:hypothetical protein VitviT2T_003041 [Vitis vinifera]